MSNENLVLEKKVLCRLCGSANISPALLKKNYYLLNLDCSVGLNYAVCYDCQYIFQLDYVGDKFLNNYYANSPMLRREKPTVYEEDQNSRQAEFLLRHMSLANRTVLEIGAHAGAFLSHLHNKHSCQVYFSELSEEACAVLKRLTGLQDYHANNNPLVDLVVIRHVLEHIDDLPRFISEVATYLKPDGNLYIEVPDWSWLDGHTDPLIFEHLSQFSSYNLLNFMFRQGWVCDALEKSVHPDDPATPNRVQRLLFKKSKLPPLGESIFGQTFMDFYKNHEGALASAINKILEGLKDQTIALYPASHLTFAALADTNLLKKNLVGLFDIDAKKQGKIISGQQVFPPEKLAELQPDVIFIFTMGYEPEVREAFAKLGLKANIISVSQILAELDIIRKAQQV